MACRFKMNACIKWWKFKMKARIEWWKFWTDNNQARGWRSKSSFYSAVEKVLGKLTWSENTKRPRKRGFTMVLPLLVLPAERSSKLHFWISSLLLHFRWSAKIEMGNEHHAGMKLHLLTLQGIFFCPKEINDRVPKGWILLVIWPDSKFCLLLAQKISSPYISVTRIESLRANDPANHVTSPPFLHHPHHPLSSFISPSL